MKQQATPSLLLPLWKILSVEHDVNVLSVKGFKSGVFLRLFFCFVLCMLSSFYKVKILLKCFRGELRGLRYQMTHLRVETNPVLKIDGENLTFHKYKFH